MCIDQPIQITGGGAGIGLVTKKNCQREGYSVALLDLNTEALEQARAALPKSDAVVTCAGSVTDEPAVAAFCDEIERQFGALHGVANGRDWA
jgi:NAD(P)-dependent dehydrogenase (short-subunit alcohol dehydrogenase family)